MNQAQYLKNLSVPTHPIDVIFDTDTYNEVDDQFALSYLLRSEEKLTVKGICAAPFLNDKSVSPEDGMNKSYKEILHILELADRTDLNPLVFHGSASFLTNETTPVFSDAATHIANLASSYSPEHPLYIVAVGAITNVASALLLRPAIYENIVIVWLGGHCLDWGNTNEFNMCQDVAAARVVMGSGAPFIQLPACGVVDHFQITCAELEAWLVGKNPLADYLASYTISEVSKYDSTHLWSRVIWDVCGIGWLLNDNDRFMASRLEHIPIPQYDNHYSFDSSRPLMSYVYQIKRDPLLNDLFTKLLREDD